ncbi:MAG: AAA family ATPase [Candidatus Dormibacteria bacterium]
MQARAPRGVELEDRLLFGLTASRLAWAAGGVAIAYLLIQSRLPRPLSIPAALLVAAVAAALTWGRLSGRTLDYWGLLVLRYWVRVWLAPRITRDAHDDEPVEPGRSLHLMPEPAEAPSIDPEPRPAPAFVTRLPRLALSALRRQSEVPRRWEPDPDDSIEMQPAAPATAPEDRRTPPESTTLHVERRAAIAPDDTPEDDDEPEPEADLSDSSVVSDQRVIRFPVETEFAEEDWRTTMPATPAPTFVGAARRLTFFSLKGGLGRTTLACEVGALLSARGRVQNAVTGEESRLRVALIDLDLSSATVSMRLGLIQPTWWEHVTAPAPPPLEQVLTVHRQSGLSVLLGPPKSVREDGAVPLEPARVVRMLDEVESLGFHFLIVDLSGDLGAVNRAVLDWCHDIFVVTAPTASALQATYRTAESLRRLGLGAKLQYVEQRSRGTEEKLRDVMGDLGGRLVGAIPHDLHFDDAENRHRPLVMDGGTTSDAIARLARMLYPSLDVPGIGGNPARRLLSRFGR